MSPTERRALAALNENGGSGAIQKNGKILAAGITLGEYQSGHLASAYSAATFLRLVSKDLVMGAGPNRICITLDGVAALANSRTKP